MAAQNGARLLDPRKRRGLVGRRQIGAVLEMGCKGLQRLAEPRQLQSHVHRALFHRFELSVDPRGQIVRRGRLVLSLSPADRGGEARRRGEPDDAADQAETAD